MGQRKTRIKIITIIKITKNNTKITKIKYRIEREKKYIKRERYAPVPRMELEEAGVGLRA
jgi:hypothetical protein